MFEKLKNWIPSIGLLGLIVTIITLVIETRHNNEILMQNNLLVEKELQNELFKSALELESRIEQKRFIEFLFNNGLIDSTKYALEKLTKELSNIQGYVAGYTDSAPINSINGALFQFYDKNKVVPKDLKLLALEMNVSKALNHFKGNCYYRRFSNDYFIIVYPGSDGYIHTKDDYIYHFEDGQVVLKGN